MPSSYDFSLYHVLLVLVDKDQSPKWIHKRIEDVSPDEVLSYFEPVPKELQL